MQPKYEVGQTVTWEGPNKRGVTGRWTGVVIEVVPSEHDGNEDLYVLAIPADGTPTAYGKEYLVWESEVIEEAKQ